MELKQGIAGRGAWVADAVAKTFAVLCLPFLLLVGLLLLPLLLMAIPFLFFLVFFLLAPPHRNSQPCTCCERMAKFISEDVREGEGRRSWTDLIIAVYKCPNGHTFSKEWTGSAWGD